MFIVIEGAGGVGKTELTDRLPAALQELGYTVLERQEPTKDLPHGQRFRSMCAQGTRMSVTTEMQLLMDDRRDNLATFVKPALKAGKVVIQSRYFYSSAAYQSNGRRGDDGIDWKEILRWNRAFAPEPDVLIYLECDVKEALRRTTQRDKADSRVYEQEAYQEKVKATFEECLQEVAENRRCPVISCDTTKRTPDEVFELVMQQLKPLLPKPASKS